MQIYEYKPGVKIPGERVICLGFFDGVHSGHRRLIASAKKEAERLGLPLAVFTFPSESAELKNSKERLYPTDIKAELLCEAGADELMLADFSRVKGIPPEEFINSTLIGDLNCRAAASGRDYRFGRGAMGNAELLERLMKAGGRAALFEEDAILFGKKISTSAIKEYLSLGKVKEANAMLARPYFFDAEAEHGRGVGRELGYPTVNSPLYLGAPYLALGVYISKVEIDGITYPALTNIGICPTFEERPVHAESFIIDYIGNLYGKRVRISLTDFLRKEIRFDSPKALTEQIKKDVEKAKGEF